MAFFCTLASGSKGNCSLISDGSTHILIDMGISLRQTALCLSKFGLSPADLSGVLISHEHTDHVRGLGALCKKHRLPLYATAGTAEALCGCKPGLESGLTAFEAGDSFPLGSLFISSFKTPHDSAESCGFRIEGRGLSLGYMTDLGYVPPQALKVLAGAEHLILESNHDVGLLKKGSYPAFLKRRILSQRGHLSNTEAGEAAAFLLKYGTKSFTLAHLSRENNCPRTALDTVRLALDAAGADSGVSVDVAPEGMGVPRRPGYSDGGRQLWKPLASSASGS